MEHYYWKSTAHPAWIYWTGICNESRNAGLNHIKDCIDTYGFIVDHHLFSDISIGLRIEIEENKVKKLHEALGRILSMSEFTEKTSDSTSERTVMLNITFTHATGDLKVEVPNVPG